MNGSNERGYLNRCTDEEIIEAVGKSKSYNEALEYLNYGVSGKQHLNLQAFVKQNNISVDHFAQHYDVNRDFFKVLNEKSCYWLGFGLADGNVCLNYFKIHLAIEDEEHLKNFYKDLGHKGKLFYSEPKPMEIDNRQCECQPSATATIYSRELVKDLINLQCLPNKTKYGCFISPLIPKELRRDVVRGVYDGDGSITMPKRKNSTELQQLNLYILGDYNFLDQIRKIVVEEVGVNMPTISQRQGVCCIQWSGNRQCRKIFDWMYSDCVRWLPRKREKYDNFIEYYEAVMAGTIKKR